MIRAVVSAHVNASADFVRTLFEDPDNWAKLFPATIRGAHVVRRDQHRTVVEVSHIEGKVVNILQFISPARIDLTEFKRRYTATFPNESNLSGAIRRISLLSAFGPTQSAAEPSGSQIMRVN